MNLKAVQEDRKTVVRFDIAAKYLIEPAVAISRNYEQMLKGTGSVKVNVKVTDGVGVEVEAKQYKLASLHEQTEVPSNRLLSISSGNVQTPSGLTEIPMWRAPEQPGAATGSLPSMSTSGDKFLDKKITAGTNWNGVEYRLSDDENAYASPDPDLDTIPMLRILRTFGVHDPLDDICFRFKVPGHTVGATSTIVTLYFSGPAGCDGTWTGRGQYAVKFGGDGIATIYEFCFKITDEDGLVDQWVKRREFRYSEPHRVMGASHKIMVRFVEDKRSQLVSKTVGNGHIVFECSSGDDATTKRGGGLLAKLAVAPNSYLYRVPFTPTYRQGSTTLSRTKAPVTEKAFLRIDMRQDIRPLVQTTYMAYPPTASFIDDVVTLVVPTYNLSEPLRVVWFASVPPECSFRMRLFDPNTLTELTQIGDVVPIVNSEGQEQGGYVYYQPVQGAQSYQPRGEYTTNTRQRPVLTVYRLEREPVFAQDDGSDEFTTEFPAVVGLVPWSLNDLSISGAQTDPSEESASFTIRDLTRNFTQFDSRASIPAQIEVQYDPNDPTAKCVLFRGFAEKIVGQRKGTERVDGLAGALANYPNANWKKLDVTLLSEWMKVMESHPPKRWFWSADPSSAVAGIAILPYKVTEACRLLLNWAGYEDNQIDIPDIDFRFWPTGDDNEAMMMDPLSSIADALMHFSRDYLGKFLVFCPNSQPVGDPHERGMWRMVDPATPPYNPLAHFHTSAAVDANKLVHYEGSWPDVVDGAQTSPSTYIRKGSLSTHIRRPEANLICISGTGYGLYENTQDQLTVTLPNYRSYNFAGLTSGHPQMPLKSDPDYLGRVVPMVRVDNSLTRPEAVKWVCHRIFDRAAHGAKMIKFVAPLLFVTDSTDALQFRPRKLRFYDAITVDGFTYLVRSCNVEVSKDHKQMMVIEAELPNGVMS